MLSVVCFKWKRIATGYQLPAVCDYTADHVNILRRMVARHLTVPHRFICVTDDFVGLKTGIEKVPLWDKCRELGGCYNRLYAFSEEVRPLLGDRLVLLDLDCVITGDVTPLFTMPVDFATNAYFGQAKYQRYNGALVIMDTGARRQVWDLFDGKRSAALVAGRMARGHLSGSDQGWMAHILPPTERVIGPWDGVHEAMFLEGSLPKDARIVFYSGKRDPSQSRDPWVREHWR